jgi:branched-chain amino acid transport system permease protein
MSHALFVLQIALIYGLAVVPLRLCAGFAGLYPVSQAAFFGIGAYSTALLAKANGWLPALGIGAIIAGILALFVGTASLRLRDDYFVMATFGVQAVIYNVMLNWTEVTRGPVGIGAVPPPNFGSWVLASRGAQILLLSATLSATLYLVHRLSESPFGWGLRAIREDEVLTQALGRNPAQLKITAFTLAAVLAAVAGSFLASAVTFVDPSAFTIHESIFMLAILLCGGSRSIAGPVLGAIVLVGIPEILRYLGLPTLAAAHLRQILYGALLVTFMLTRPGGLVGEP